MDYLQLMNSELNTYELTQSITTNEYNIMLLSDSLL